MELNEILKKVSQLSKKEDKLSFLTLQIWKTLYECETSHDLDTNKLYTLTTEYAKCSFDAKNVPVNFKEMNNNQKGSFNRFKGVFVNANKFKKEVMAPVDMSTYAEFLYTISHELTHHNDHRTHKKNHLKADPRFPRGNGFLNYLNALGELTQKPQYKTLGEVLYYKSSNEFVARNIGFHFALGLVEQLRKITERHPQHPNNTNLIFLNAKLDEIEDHTFLQHSPESQLKKTQQILQETLPDAQQDFFEQCNKYLCDKCTNDDLKIFDLTYMTGLLTKPEFANNDIAQKMFNKLLHNTKIPNKTLIDALGNLSSIQDLHISKTMRKQLLANYEENKKQQNNVSEK